MSRPSLSSLVCCKFEARSIPPPASFSPEKMVRGMKGVIRGARKGGFGGCRRNHVSEATTFLIAPASSIYIAALPRYFTDREYACFYSRSLESSFIAGCFGVGNELDVNWGRLLGIRPNASAPAQMS